MSILAAFTAWLPYPVYRFVGGPIDGQELEVQLVERADGMVPLERVQVRELPKVQLKPGPEALPADLSCRTFTYRFVPDRGQINIGHYEHVPDQ